MHQCESGQIGPRAYVVELQPGVVKIGYSANSDRRVSKAYPNHLSCIVSPVHVDALETEKKLKEWCHLNGKIMIGRECFSGVEFEEILGFATELFAEYREVESVGTSFINADFELVHPNSQEFSVCGTAATQERAREWALDNRYLLVAGSRLATCAHGFYMLPQCPNYGSCRSFGFDHTQMWVEDQERGIAKSFLLTQPYGIPEGLKRYADAHGLVYGEYTLGLNNWYSSKTTAIILRPSNNWPLLPLDREASTILAVAPVRWTNRS